ncbi:hypothetical protein GA0115234_1104117 [Streptomyces sp. DvalAA-43]|nr:hypothetical protein GA0115234_1104117 [Streptomyces sp. DvalAA-43]
MLQGDIRYGCMKVNDTLRHSADKGLRLVQAGKVAFEGLHDAVLLSERGHRDRPRLENGLTDVLLSSSFARPEQLCPL